MPSSDYHRRPLQTVNFSAVHMISREVNLQIQCSLFQLPAEIRNEIYTLALTVTSSSPAYIGSYNRLGNSAVITTNPEHPERPSVLSLLQTCRLIHDEALGIFYSTQPLHLITPNGQFISGMARALDNGRLQAIRRLKITVRHFEGLTLVLNSIRHLSSLHVAHIHLCPLTLRPTLNSVKELQRELPFLKAACAGLSTSLKHLFLTLDPRQAPYYPGRDTKARATRDELVHILQKYPSREAEHAKNALDAKCACIWCGSTSDTNKQDGQASVAAT